jgi:hypothetical protein
MNGVQHQVTEAQQLLPRRGDGYDNVPRRMPGSREYPDTGQYLFLAGDETDPLSYGGEIPVGETQKYVSPMFWENSLGLSFHPEVPLDSRHDPLGLREDHASLSVNIAAKMIRMPMGQDHVVDFSRFDSRRAQTSEESPRISTECTRARVNKNTVFSGRDQKASVGARPRFPLPQVNAVFLEPSLKTAPGGIHEEEVPGRRKDGRPIGECAVAQGHAVDAAYLEMIRV